MHDDDASDASDEKGVAVVKGKWVCENEPSPPSGIHLSLGRPVRRKLTGVFVASGSILDEFEKKLLKAWREVTRK